MADPQPKAQPEAHGSARIAAVIDSLGQPGFDVAFREYLLSICRADYFALYQVGGNQLLDISAGGAQQGWVASKQAKLFASGGFWRRDPGLQALRDHEADGRPVIAHMSIDHIRDDETRERIYRPYFVSERVVVGARAPRSAVAISLMRTQRHGPFTHDDLASLEAASEGIVALAMKHVAMKRSADQTRSALTSLSTIEACLADAPHRLTRREAEVCARILYGMTSMGIALALGISEESAMTYRKRAYHRLEIGSQRELLLWYFDQWSRHASDAEIENAA